MRRWTELVFNLLAAIVILVDGIARPLYRPILAWMATITIIQRIEKAIGRLPRAVILLLFAVPFAIAEPAKVLALVWIAQGWLISGLLLLAIAYLATFLIVERIYHAGKAKLLTYRWFAWCMDQLTVVRYHLSGAKRRLREALVRWFRS